MNTSPTDLSAFHQLMRKGQINLLNLTLNENLSQCELDDVEVKGAHQALSFRGEE
jgi:hypothetical protein